MNNLNLELSSRDSQIDELTEINRKLKKECQIMQDSVISQNIKNVEIMNHVNELYEKSYSSHCINCLKAIPLNDSYMMKVNPNHEN